MRTSLLIAAAIGAASLVGSASGSVIIPGGFQGWDPGTAPAMTETSPGSNVFAYTISGQTPGSKIEFKILDDGGDGGSWSDPSLAGGSNDFAYADGSGSVVVTIDRNVYSDGYAHNTGRVTTSTGPAAVYAVGDFMNEAGGAGDWNPGDASFVMNAIGGGDYSLTKLISTPGTYQYKATQGNWDGQWGTDGRSVNGDTWLFTTTSANQPVTFYASTSRDGIMVAVPEPTTIAALGGLAAMALRRRK